MLIPFPLPNLSDPLTSHQANEAARQFVARRRSTPVKALDPSGPGPTGDALDAILSAAMRVPDHRKLEPWRLIVFEGEARARFGQHLSQIHADATPEASPDELKTEAHRLLRAPVCVSVISSPVIPHKTPVWEQELSAGALCLNLLYAASAAGWAGSWITEWWAFDDRVNALLGLTETERVAGHIFLGTALSEPTERARPDLSKKVMRWSA